MARPRPWHVVAGVGALVVVLVGTLLVLDARRGPGPSADRPDGTGTPSAPAPTGTDTGADTGAVDLTTVLASGFDTGTDGWQPLGAAAVALDLDTARTGPGSLRVGQRAQAWNGAMLDVTGLLQPSTVHTASAWVRLPDGADPAELQLTVEHDPDGDDPTFDHLARATATADGWVELHADYTPPEQTGPARLYVETTGSLTDFLVDDVTLTRAALPVQTDIPALRDVLADDFPVGAAVGPQDLVGRPAELLARHFGSLTPENALKPAAVQPEEGRFELAAADQILDFAVQHGLGVYGHTLVWYRSTPDWFFLGADGQPLTDSAADQALLLARLEAHVRAIADHVRERYGADDPVWAWDVVNEAIDPSQEDGLRRNRWYDVLGPDYVADAFRIAREAFGDDTLLFLNDYDTEFPDRRRALAQVVQRLLDAGVPIDGVGHQLHLRLGASTDRIGETFDTFAALGVRQAVTELDVSISRSTDEQLDSTPPDRLREQGETYADLMDLFRAHADDLTSVSFWGLYDTRSWLRTWPDARPFEAPLLFDDDLQAKPAFWGVVDRSRLSG
ncbi:endo-1,4-beta-xylanase [Cellulomonas hominis]